MDKRLDLLNYLLTQKRTVPNRELQSVLTVSRRTVINYVNEINSLAPDTVFSSSQGYRCIDSPAVRKLMQEFHNAQSFDSFEKRSSFLFRELMLKSSHPTLDELADAMFISPSTLSNELIRIRATLKEQNLYLKTKNNRLYIIGDDRESVNSPCPCSVRNSGNLTLICRPCSAFSPAQTFLRSARSWRRL